MRKAVSHFITITKHRTLVMLGCFQVGLYWQGLTHDLSKYAPDEFLVGAKYYQGDRSPNAAERESLGYSTAWMHHKGRNKHHYEYWSDYSKATCTMKPVPMPDRYVIEMVMDRIAACKIYQKSAYTDSAALEYYNKALDHDLMHEQTRKQLSAILTFLSKYGEHKTFSMIRRRILHNDHFINRFVASKVEAFCLKRKVEKKDER